MFLMQRYYLWYISRLRAMVFGISFPLTRNEMPGFFRSSFAFHFLFLTADAVRHKKVRKQQTCKNKHNIVS